MLPLGDFSKKLAAKIGNFAFKEKGREKTRMVKAAKSCHQVTWTQKNFVISLSNEFGVNVLHSLVERKVKIKNRLSTFAVVGVVNSEIFMSFTKLLF